MLVGSMSCNMRTKPCTRCARGLQESVTVVNKSSRCHHTLLRRTLHKWVIWGDLLRETAATCNGLPQALPPKAREPVLARSAILKHSGLWALLSAFSLLEPKKAGAELQLADVTPPIAVAGRLPSREEAIVELFERSTFSVVNVIDITLPGRPPSAPAADVPEGNGTGVVWDLDGHVVTNYHVLGNVLKGIPPNMLSRKPKVAIVKLLGSDGVTQSFEGVLVGVDKARDVAVLRVSAPPSLLRAMPLGTSSSLRVGQQCLAIGNPFGFDHTLTTGVISGLNRDISSQMGSLIPGGIQTDAAINPGNSGGPLLDSAGRLIGLNTAIFTNTGTSAGVGFALPVDLVAKVVPQLISNGLVTRPSLNLQTAPEDLAKKLGVPFPGALIQSLEADGAGAAAGLLATRRGLGGIIAGDLITAVDGRPVRSGTDLVKVLELYQVGDTVELQVKRTGQGNGDKQDEVTLSAVLQAEKLPK